MVSEAVGATPTIEYHPSGGLRVLIAPGSITTLQPAKSSKACSARNVETSVSITLTRSSRA